MFMLWFIVSVILRRYMHESGYSAATPERSCRRHLTGAPTQSHYKLTPGQPDILLSTHISMPSVRKGATGTIFYDYWYVEAWDRTNNIPYPKRTLYHWGLLENAVPVLLIWFPWLPSCRQTLMFKCLILKTYKRLQISGRIGTSLQNCKHM